jgi:hypothetical protein
MSLSANRSRLTALTRELSAHWEDTKTYWRDSKSLEFEQQYLQNLSAQIDKTVTALEKLDHLLTKVRKDCE